MYDYQLHTADRTGLILQHYWGE